MNVYIGFHDSPSNHWDISLIYNHLATGWQQRNTFVSYVSGGNACCRHKDGDKEAGGWSQEAHCTDEWVRIRPLLAEPPRQNRAETPSQNARHHRHSSEDVTAQGAEAALLKLCCDFTGNETDDRWHKSKVTLHLSMGLQGSFSHGFWSPWKTWALDRKAGVQKPSAPTRKAVAVTPSVDHT